MYRALPISVVLALGIVGCDLFQPPPSDADAVATDTDTSDTLAPCAPESALIPFVASVAREGEDETEVLTTSLLASGQCQVLYAGAATGALAEAGYEAEVRLQFYDDPHPVVLALALPHAAPAPAVAYGETLVGVVARTSHGKAGVDVYVALRGVVDGALRAWLIQGSSGGLPDGVDCPLGFDCPAAVLAEPDCASLQDDCGARVWPALEIRPAAASDPVTLRQGETAVIGSRGQAWTFLVCYASRLDGEVACTDTPAADLAAAILFGAVP